jgi:hypothetical protein
MYLTVRYWSSGAVHNKHKDNGSTFIKPNKSRIIRRGLMKHKRENREKERKKKKIELLMNFLLLQSSTVFFSLDFCII